MRVSLRICFAALFVALAGCQTGSFQPNQLFDWMLTDHVEEYWPSGKLRKEGDLVRGEQEGKWVFYHENGNKKGEGTYVHDVQEGRWTYWFDNGNKEMEGNFIGQRREGFWTYQHRNGQPQASGRFHRGLEEGEWTFWTRRGALDQRGDFENGKPTLRWTYWYPEGQLKAEGFQAAGRPVGPWRFFTPTGEVSVKNYSMPDGYELVFETWDTGSVRRLGFLEHGRPVGRWVSFHRNGQRRFEGNFKDGLASGPWTAWSGEGDLVALGTVENGRPIGEWSVYEDGVERSWTVESYRPPPPLTGSWSEASAVKDYGPERVVELWLGEINTPFDDSDAALVADASLPEAPPETLAAVQSTPETPLVAQPSMTHRELANRERFVENYGLGANAGRLGSGRYASRAGGRSLQDDGDKEKARPLVGKPLPVSVFAAPGGGKLTLDQFAGKKLIVVLLRGFAGSVCVYCCSYTAALAEAQEEFSRFNAQLLFVYPGTAQSLRVFREAYADYFGEEAPPVPMVYDTDRDLAELTGLEGDLAIPSTFILDERGVVRWAYVGENIEDRPSARRILDAFEGELTVP